jgi:hypothetical protein
MPFLTQAVHAPAAGCGGIGLGGADLARVQRVLEFGEERKCSACKGRLVVEERLDFSLQPTLSRRRPTDSSTFSIFREAGGWAGTIGRR